MSETEMSLPAPILENKVREEIFPTPPGYEYVKLVHRFSSDCEKYKQDDEYSVSKEVYEDCHAVFKKKSLQTE